MKAAAVDVVEREAAVEDVVGAVVVAVDDRENERIFKNWYF